MYFSLVLHNHQPIGQLPWAFEDAWRESYQPFLETLAEFPDIKIGLHFSGPLLDWLESEKPQTIILIRELASRGQIEILCGGYYEPIFVIWPREDALAQIEKSKARVYQLFGVEARGLWLTERVWEPQLAAWLDAAQVEYTLLDSTLFEDAGISETQSCGLFPIENSALKVFPINRKLRDLLPWHEPHETIEYLRGVQAEHGNDAHVLFGDDGEKFGAWPETHSYIFKDGWLKRFFEALQNESSWLHLVTPSEYSALCLPRESVMLKAGSYPEMQEWSGGNWRNFLERYQESRDMHDEVLRVRGQSLNSTEAYDHVLRAQSNDAYWHGVFGGLYLKHLRQAIYAQCAAAGVLQSRDAIKVERDNNDLIASNNLLRIGARERGGHLFLLQSTHSRHNLLATLRNYREAYQENWHDENAPIDWYPRGALLDHFFGSDVTLENFQSAHFREEGDFISEVWQLSDDAGVLRLRREGGVWHDGEFAPLIIEKEIALRENSGELEIEYSFGNPGEKPFELWWALEWNAVLSGVDWPERHYHAQDHAQKLSLENAASFDAVTNPIIADTWRKIRLEWEFSEPIAMWHAPLFSVSQKEGGAIERIYQQSAFVFHRRLKLRAGETFQTSFKAAVTARSAA